MKIVPLKPYHLGLIDVQSEQEWATWQLNEQFASAVIEAGDAWACVDGEQVHAAAGIVTDEGRTMAWAILGRNVRPYMMAITRMCRSVLAQRAGVEIFVRQGHEEGARWARLIGLHIKRTSAVTAPDGRVCDLWGM